MARTKQTARMSTAGKAPVGMSQRDEEALKDPRNCHHDGGIRKPKLSYKEAMRKKMAEAVKLAEAASHADVVVERI